MYRNRFETVFLWIAVLVSILSGAGAHADFKSYAIELIDFEQFHSSCVAGSDGLVMSTLANGSPVGAYSTFCDAAAHRACMVLMTREPLASADDFTDPNLIGSSTLQLQAFLNKYPAPTKLTPSSRQADIMAKLQEINAASMTVACAGPETAAVSCNCTCDAGGVPIDYSDVPGSSCPIVIPPGGLSPCGPLVPGVCSAQQ